MNEQRTTATDPALPWRERSTAYRAQAQLAHGPWREKWLWLADQCDARARIIDEQVGHI